MGQRRCAKCGGKKKISRHHVFGKKGYDGLKYDSKLPLLILLIWMEVEYDEVTILFWTTEIIDLCRDCHDGFHILFSRLIKECDARQSGEPIRKYLEEKNVKRMGSRFQYTH